MYSVILIYMIGIIFPIVFYTGVLLIIIKFMEHKKVKISPKLTFMHLLSMLTLYVSAISFLTIIYQIVNIALPDAVLLDSYRDESYFRDTLRSAISFFIIMFPVYIWTLKHLRSFYKKEPSLAKISARKFLVYLTMFAAGVTILFSLVFLTNSLLDGELTLNFGLKLLAVLFVTGSVFGYYSHENKLYV